MLSFFARVLGSLLLRLVLTVAVLVLGYLFVVKPLLDDAGDSAGNGGLTGGIERVVDSVSSALGDEDPGSLIEDVRSRVAGSGLSEEDARRLAECISRAGSDRQQIRRCTARFTR